MSHPVASIDQGTNTLRLLVADAGRTPPAELSREQRIVRLGGGFSGAGRLGEEAMARSLAAWDEYARILKRLGCTDVTAVGTGVLRQAPNAADFVQRVQDRTGLSLTIIAGEDEAALSLAGALWALGVEADAPGAYLIADIGGGSTELALSRKGLLAARVSLPVGVVWLLETAMPGDPPAGGEIERAREIVREHFLGAKALVREAAREDFTVVGCAGTFTTLAALAQNLETYEPARITGYRLTLGRLDALLAEALSMAAARRLAHWPVLAKGREDVIVAGMVLCQEILRHLGRSEVLVSDGSLLEGVLLRRLARL